MLPWTPAALEQLSQSFHRPGPQFVPASTMPAARWLESYLRDPAGILLALLHQLRDLGLAWGPFVTPVVAVFATAIVVGRRWWARHCHQLLLADARQITVLAPPEVDPTGGAALWANLVGLLRPKWRRTVTGQPHLAYEYAFSEAGVAIRLWVPGVIPPGEYGY